MKRFLLCTLLGRHDWGEWIHVDLPLLSNIQTGAWITRPYDKRTCLRCGRKEER